LVTLTILVDKRGISADQLRIVDGGVHPKLLVELWVVPPGENIPIPTKTEVLKSTLFDLVYSGNGCEPEYTLDRYEVTDAVSFYSDALKQHPEAKGLVFIRPSTTKPLSQARELISVTKSELEKAGLPPNIIIAAT
jgi:hypothetical protein